MVTIGFECSPDGGPGIFLTRLKKALESMSCFSLEQPDVWLQVSHKPLPSNIDWRKTKRLVRTAGGYYQRHYLIDRPFVLPLPFLDDWKSSRANEKRNRLIRNNLIEADVIVFQSDFASQMTRHFILPDVSGVRIYNGVDTSVFAPGGKKQVANNNINILVSHAFRPHKRLHEVIRVFDACVRQASRGLNLKLHVVGGDNGNVFSGIKTLIKTAELEDKIHFYGHVSQTDLPQIYNQCDLMLALPLWDPCPNTVIEALSCGLPVVTTSAGGIPELIQQAGVVVEEPLPLEYQDHVHLHRIPRVDADACAAGVWRVLDNLNEYQNMARYRAVSALDIHTIAREYLVAADSLLQTKAPVSKRGHACVSVLDVG